MLHLLLLNATIFVLADIYSLSDLVLHLAHYGSSTAFEKRFRCWALFTCVVTVSLQIYIHYTSYMAIEVNLAIPV